LRQYAGLQSLSHKGRKRRTANDLSLHHAEQMRTFRSARLTASESKPHPATAALDQVPRSGMRIWMHSVDVLLWAERTVDGSRAVRPLAAFETAAAFDRLDRSARASRFFFFLFPRLTFNHKRVHARLRLPFTFEPGANSGLKRWTVARRVPSRTATSDIVCPARYLLEHCHDPPRRLGAPWLHLAFRPMVS